MQQWLKNLCQFSLMCNVAFNAKLCSVCIYCKTEFLRIPWSVPHSAIIGPIEEPKGWSFTIKLVFFRTVFRTFKHFLVNFEWTNLEYLSSQNSVASRPKLHSIILLHQKQFVWHTNLTLERRGFRRKPTLLLSRFMGQVCPAAV